MDEDQLSESYSLSGATGNYPITKDYLTFGSSGLLYQSNKLMYDRNTDTLWHQMWGTPAFGPLVGSGIELERLPVTLTTWEAWYAEHPDTQVMDFDTGFVRDYSVGAAYADYFASPDTMFPVWQRSQALSAKSWVFTQLIGDRPKAYPLSELEEELVVNDTLAGQNLVIILEDGGRGARAYARGEHTFAPASIETTTVILDEGDTSWQVTESALIGENSEELPRLPGHMAYWFGWYSFYPQTLIYGQPQ